MSMRSFVPPVSLLAASAAGTAAGQLDPAFPAVFEASGLASGGGVSGFVLRGINADDYAGGRLASAGDMNGDGFPDLVLSAAPADPNGDLSGQVYVVFGGPGVADDPSLGGGSGGVFPLSSLDGSNGFIVNGAEAGDAAGYSVASGGDVNADGFDDLLIGAFRASPGGREFAGACYVVFGGDDVGSGGVIELGGLDGTDGFVLNGIEARDDTGNAVSAAGDLNDDGIDDFIIGAWRAGPNGIVDAGRAYVVFGAVGLGASGAVELSSLDGMNGFALNGYDEEDWAGNSVAAAGDVNDDGIDDVIIGAWRGDVGIFTRAGRAFVVFGAADVGSVGALELDSLDGSNGFVLNGFDFEDYAGGNVDAAGDMNSDGVDDLIVAATLASPNDFQSGQVYVVFGGAGVGSSGVIGLDMLDGTNGFVLNGIERRDSAGNASSSAGDVNNDGFDDLLIGAAGADTNGPSSGEAYVIFGGPSLGSGGVIELSSLNGANGFTLNGMSRENYFGVQASPIGDFNADGVDDFVVSGPGADVNGLSVVGESYVIFGRNADPCFAADVNGDGLVTPADFKAWVAAFNAQGDACDQNGDGLCSPADFNAWVVNFNAGC